MLMIMMSPATANSIMFARHGHALQWVQSVKTATASNAVRAEGIQNGLETYMIEMQVSRMDVCHEATLAQNPTLNVAKPGKGVAADIHCRSGGPLVDDIRQQQPELSVMYRRWGCCVLIVSAASRLSLCLQTYKP